MLIIVIYYYYYYSCIYFFTINPNVDIYPLHMPCYRWKFVIHGGIDGYSRLLTFLDISEENTKERLTKHFLGAVKQYGLPSRIRVDHGGENSNICQLMECVRGTGRGSAIRGKSVHNQRIERAWVDVWNGVSNLYHDLFNYMETKGFLNIDEPIHIFALHFTYLPRIARDLRLFRMQWNSHGLRTAHHFSPEQLFVSRSLELYNSGSTAMSDLFNIPESTDTVHAPSTACVTDEPGGHETHEGDHTSALSAVRDLIDFNWTQPPTAVGRNAMHRALTDEQQAHLVTIDPLDDSDGEYGITIYLRVLQCLYDV